MTALTGEKAKKRKKMTRISDILFTFAPKI
jgi:hypothetical protein